MKCQYFATKISPKQRCMHYVVYIVSASSTKLIAQRQHAHNQCNTQFNSFAENDELITFKSSYLFFFFFFAQCMLVMLNSTIIELCEEQRRSTDLPTRFCSWYCGLCSNTYRTHFKVTYKKYKHNDKLNTPTTTYSKV